MKLRRTDDLANWLESAYRFLAKVTYPYPSEFLMRLPGNPIKEVTGNLVIQDKLTVLR